MRKVIFAMMILLIIIFSGACSKTKDKNAEINQNKNIKKTENQIADQETKTTDENAQTEEYLGVDYCDFPLMEIALEKISFDGKSFREISGGPFRKLYESMMARSVKFFMAAIKDDINTMKKFAQQELMDEIETALKDEDGRNYCLGGKEIVSLKNLTKYKKAYNIKAPKEVEKNIYEVEMRDLETLTVRVTFEVTSSEEPLIKSFEVVSK